MSKLAQNKTGLGLAYEICVQNADKLLLAIMKFKEPLRSLKASMTGSLQKQVNSQIKLPSFPILFLWSALIP